MTYTITDVYDQKRGCGWRVGGGLYLRSDGISQECGMLPIKLQDCPCCGRTIKLTRGLQKVDVQRLIQDARCTNDDENYGRPESCKLCLINRTGMGYLIGIGSKFYKSKWDYIRESVEMGVSKRIAQIPRDFVVGRTVILVAHPKVFSELVPEKAEDTEIEEDAVAPRLPMIEGHSETTGRMVVKDVPGVIAVFVPDRIEYVVRDTDTPEELERLAKRKITLVRVHRVEEKQLELEKPKTG